MSAIKSFEKIFIQLIKAVLIADFCAMVVIVGAQVVVRFLAANAINMSGAEELTRILLCYMTFLGSTLLYESHGHVWVANLVDAVNPMVRKGLLLISYVIQMIFFIFVLIGTSKIMPVVATQTTSVLHIPMNIVYIGIPVMVICCCVFCIRDFVFIIQGKEV